MNTVNPDRKAFVEDLYRECLSEVRHYFVRYTRDMMKAEDMTQDLFIRLLHYDGLIAQEAAKSLLFTIARRMLIDEARHLAFVAQASQAYRLQKESDSFWQESMTLECRQIEEMERAAIRRLPQKTARVYYMSRMEEKTAQEIADEMKTSKRTVECQLLKSRRVVRQALRQAINM